MKELVIQYVPHHEIESLDSTGRIKKLLTIVKEDKIVLLEGRMRKEEETGLIQKTMESISRKFKGIELATIDSQSASESFSAKFKNSLAKLLLGNRQGLTIIGPATVVREIKQDPNKIQLYMSNARR